MRIELQDDANKPQTEANDSSSEFAKMVAGQKTQEDTKRKFSELPLKGKIAYIWDYYKWWFIGAAIVAIISVSLIRSIIENSKPMYINVEMLNTYLATDPDNSLEDDYIRETGIDLNEYNYNIGTNIFLSNDTFDTTMLAYQQRLVANYAAADLDVVIGPVGIMEGAANCGGYGDLNQFLPADLLEELKDREYEFYYFDPAADQIEDYEGEDLTPYFAGVYLDTCSYLNDLGESGAYPEPETDKDRVIFTIPANTKNPEHAAEFLRFLIHNH